MHEQITFDKCIHSCNCYHIVGVYQFYYFFKEPDFVFACVLFMFTFVFLCLLLFIIWFYYMVPSKHMRDDLFPASPLTSGGLLANFGAPRLVDASPQSLSSFTWHFSYMHVCIQIPPFCKNISDNGLRPILVTSSEFDHLQKTAFPNKFTFIATGD